MKQTDFRGERGAHHVECTNCGIDLHVMNWEVETTDAEPTACPYCGSEEIWSANEAIVTRTN